MTGNIYSSPFRKFYTFFFILQTSLLWYYYLEEAQYLENPIDASYLSFIGRKFSFCAFVKVSHIVYLLHITLMAAGALWTSYGYVPIGLLLDYLPSTNAGYFVQADWWCISCGVYPLFWALHFFTFQLLGACSKCSGCSENFVSSLYTLYQMLLFWSIYRKASFWLGSSSNLICCNKSRHSTPQQKSFRIWSRRCSPGTSDHCLSDSALTRWPLKARRMIVVAKLIRIAETKKITKPLTPARS